jgi:hypothetical protein
VFGSDDDEASPIAQFEAGVSPSTVLTTLTKGGIKVKGIVSLVVLSITTLIPTSFTRLLCNSLTFF